MKVLIVDDDQISRYPLVPLSKRLKGVTEVVEAADGEEGWSLMQSGQRPSLCCCDLSMPRLDGVGLLKRAKADRLLRYVPFVMISSVADRQSVTGAIQAGAVGFIVKPFSYEETYRTLERVLRQSQEKIAEPLSIVARRLGTTKYEVTRLMQKLQSDVSDCVGQLDTGSSASALLPKIQGIKASCALLGLKFCVDLLQTDIGDSGGLEGDCRASLKEVKLHVSLAIEGAKLQG